MIFGDQTKVAVLAIPVHAADQLWGVSGTGPVSLLYLDASKTFGEAEDIAITSERTPKPRSFPCDRQISLLYRNNLMRKLWNGILSRVANASQVAAAALCRVRSWVLLIFFFTRSLEEGV